MAQLKDLIVNGSSRFIGPTYGIDLSEIENADDLKAIEALSGTSGFLQKTAANTWTLNTGSMGTGTVTNVATGAGLTGGPITTSGTVKANLKSETASSLAAADKGSTANREYAVGLDSSNKLSVNIPWTNTTYTFAGGTNKFTVTPAGGSAQDVTVTPSITNNITGSGTSGYLTKFNGTNTITNGPALGSDTTKYLNNKGEWAVPPNDKGVTSITINTSAPLSGGSSTAATTTGSWTIAHNTSGVTAGSYGDTSAQTPAFGGTFKVPSFSVNTTGHLSVAGEHTVTLPNETKNTAGSTDTSSKIFLIGATSQAANPQTYSDNEVYATNGQLDAKSFRVATTATITYNATSTCLEITV